MNEEVYEGDLVQKTQDLAIIESHSIAMLDQARQMLAEVTTVPELRQVQEQLRFITDAARRAAVLAEGQHLAAEHVQAMRDFANDAAGSYIESQAKAGAILKEMEERGERQPQGRPRKGSPENLLTLDELGIPRLEAWKWVKIHGIPSEIRSTYIRTAKNRNEEVTTKGLFRFAAEPKEPKSDGRSTIEMGYDHIVKCLTEVIGYDPVVMAGEAINTNRKTKYVQLIQKAGDWIEASLDALGQ